MSSFIWTTGTLANLATEFPRMRAAGFDVVHSYSITPSTSYADTVAYLDALQSEGLAAMLNVMPLGRNLVYERTEKALSVSEVQAITDYAELYSAHPAVWGWYADDEGAASNYPITTRQQVYDALKAGAPTMPVLEAHYHIESGAYSPGTHDWYAIHAGTAYDTAYVYKYDDAPAANDHGCISKTTGLVTLPAEEATALSMFGANLASIKATLDAAGETNYFALLGVFRQTTNGTMQLFAMPPADGVGKMWDQARTNLPSDHVGCFLWWYPPYTGGTPGEHLEGVGQGHTDQLDQLTTVAKSASDEAALDVTLGFVPSTTTYELAVAIELITEVHAHQSLVANISSVIAQSTASTASVSAIRTLGATVTAALAHTASPTPVRAVASAVSLDAQAAASPTPIRQVAAMITADTTVSVPLTRVQRLVASVGATLALAASLFPAATRYVGRLTTATTQSGRTSSATRQTGRITPRR